MLHCATLCYTVLHSATLCYIVLHCATLCYTVLHFATLCYTVLHCATLFYTVINRDNCQPSAATGRKLLKEFICMEISTLYTIHCILCILYVFDVNVLWRKQNLYIREDGKEKVKGV